MTNFKKSIFESGKRFFEHHKCSLCGYPVGYRIESSNVFYDGSCDCCPSASDLQPISWEEFRKFMEQKGWEVLPKKEV